MGGLHEVVGEPMASTLFVGAREALQAMLGVHSFATMLKAKLCAQQTCVIALPQVNMLGRLFLASRICHRMRISLQPGWQPMAQYPLVWQSRSELCGRAIQEEF